MAAIHICGRTSLPRPASPTAIIHNASFPDHFLPSIANDAVKLPPLKPDLVEKAKLIAKMSNKLQPISAHQTLADLESLKKSEPKLAFEIIQHPERGSAFDHRSSTMWDGAPPVVPATLAELKLQDEEGQLFSFDIRHLICTLEVMRVEGDKVEKIELHERQIDQFETKPVYADVHESGTTLLPTIFAFDQVQVPELGHYRFRLSLRRRLPAGITDNGLPSIDEDLLSLKAESNVFQVVRNAEYEARDNVMTPMSRQMLRAVPAFYAPPAYRLPERALTGNSNVELMNK